MAEKKYELTDETIEYEGRTLHRIRALVDFKAADSGERFEHLPDIKIKAGDLGGWVSGEHNLSHEGSCWVANDAKVMDDAVVKEDALVAHEAVVSDKAYVADDACVGDSARVSDCALIEDFALVCENARISGDASLADTASVWGNAEVSGNARVYGDVFENAKVYGDAWIGGGVELAEEDKVNCGSIYMDDMAEPDFDLSEFYDPDLDDCSAKDTLEKSVENADRGSEKHSPIKQQTR